MGTNFYLEGKPPCPCCKRGYELKHIGKSSGGWCFALHIIPEEGISTLEDWKREWQGKVIRNEYDEVVSEADMLGIITKRSWPRKPADNFPSWYAENHAVPGPNGLARHQLGERVVGHGKGTWDYITGEFC